MLSLAIDANFRLKNRLGAHVSNDVGLGTGWAYFVEDEPYKSWILSHTTQTDVSTRPPCPLMV